MSDSIRSDLPGALAVADPVAVRANKLDLLERLADALAHEIKNPLHSMVINLEVLKRRLMRAPTEGADVLRYANVLGEELDRVNHRIELLLRLSRPDRGGTDDTTLNELLDEVMELVSLEARHREAHVGYERGERMARIHLGRQYARQIILNLVLDALDGLAGGETLRIGLRAGGRPRRDDRYGAFVVRGGRAAGGGRRPGRGRGRTGGYRRRRAHPGSPAGTGALRKPTCCCANGLTAIVGRPYLDGLRNRKSPDRNYGYG